MPERQCAGARRGGGTARGTWAKGEGGVGDPQPPGGAVARCGGALGSRPWLCQRERGQVFVRDNKEQVQRETARAPSCHVTPKRCVAEGVDGQLFRETDQVFIGNQSEQLQRELAPAPSSHISCSDDALCPCVLAHVTMRCTLGVLEQWLCGRERAGESDCLCV